MLPRPSRFIGAFFWIFSGGFSPAKCYNFVNFNAAGYECNGKSSLLRIPFDVPALSVVVRRPRATRQERMRNTSLAHNPTRRRVHNDGLHKRMRQTHTIKAVSNTRRDTIALPPRGTRRVLTNGRQRGVTLHWNETAIANEK